MFFEDGKKAVVDWVAVGEGDKLTRVKTFSELCCKR
jgi:hypothetical protein